MIAAVDINPIPAAIVAVCLLGIYVCANPALFDRVAALLSVWRAARPKVWMSWREIREWQAPEPQPSAEFIDWSSIDWDAVQATRERRAA